MWQRLCSIGKRSVVFLFHCCSVVFCYFFLCCCHFAYCYTSIPCCYPDFQCFFLPFYHLASLYSAIIHPSLTFLLPCITLPLSLYLVITLPFLTFSFSIHLFLHFLPFRCRLDYLHYSVVTIYIPVVGYLPSSLWTLLSEIELLLLLSLLLF